MRAFLLPLLLISLIASVLSFAALKIIRLDSSWDRGHSFFFSKGFPFIEFENSGDRCVFEMAIDTLTSYEMLKWGLEMQTWEESSLETWLKNHDILDLNFIGNVIS